MSSLEPRRHRAVVTPDAPAPAHTFSQGVISGPLVQVSGQGPVDPVTQEYLHPGDVARQTVRTLANVHAILAASGAGLGDVLMLRVYLASRDDFGAMNDAYAAYLSEHLGDAAPPSRTTVICTLPREEMLVEIDALAWLDAGSR